MYLSFTVLLVGTWPCAGHMLIDRACATPARRDFQCTMPWMLVAALRCTVTDETVTRGLGVPRPLRHLSALPYPSGPAGDRNLPQTPAAGGPAQWQSEFRVPANGSLLPAERAACFRVNLNFADSQQTRHNTEDPRHHSSTDPRGPQESTGRIKAANSDVRSGQVRYITLRLGQNLGP
jgi:hypothetical protein